MGFAHKRNRIFVVACRASPYLEAHWQLVVKVNNRAKLDMAADFPPLFLVSLKHGL